MHGRKGKSCGSKGANAGGTGVSPVVWVYNNASIYSRGDCTLAGTISQVMGGGKTNGAVGGVIGRTNERREFSDAMGTEPNHQHHIIPRE